MYVIEPHLRWNGLPPPTGDQTIRPSNNWNQHYNYLVRSYAICTYKYSNTVLITTIFNIKVYTYNDVEVFGSFGIAQGNITVSTFNEV